MPWNYSIHLFFNYLFSAFFPARFQKNWIEFQYLDFEGSSLSKNSTPIFILFLANFAKKNPFNFTNLEHIIAYISESLEFFETTLKNALNSSFYYFNRYETEAVNSWRLWLRFDPDYLYSKTGSSEPEDYY